MSQSSKMNDALKKYVVAPLQTLGFTGEFPHYRKVYDNRIELFTVQKNKWGTIRYEWAEGGIIIEDVYESQLTEYNG